MQFENIVIALFLLFFLSSNQLFAGSKEPDIPIKGTVVDSVSGEAISFVTIQIESNGNVFKRLATDASGKFSFNLNQQGAYNEMFNSLNNKMK